MKWAAYAHPVFGSLVVVCVFLLGSLAVRARNWPKMRAVSLQQHARFGPWVCLAALLAHASGMAALVWARSDLTPFASVHFRSGALLVFLLLLLLLSRPFMHRDAVRQLHPWIGALTLLVAGVHVFFGLQLTR